MQTPQVTGDKSLGQRCNVHSAMVLRALEETRLVIFPGIGLSWDFFTLVNHQKHPVVRYSIIVFY